MRRLRTAARTTAAGLPSCFRNAVAAWLFLAHPAAAAEFAAGLAAYDAGDYQAAIAEWRPLAEAGDRDAQVALAGLYQDGLGVARNSGQAIAWYRQAAEAGHPVAQLNLGDLYARGAGVPANLVEAYVWLSLAARQGRDWAEDRAAAIAGRLDAAGRAAAAERLARFTAAP